MFWERPTDQVSLTEVARRAGTTKQTVLRHFQSKDRLFAAAGERAFAQVRAEREEVAAGDVERAVGVLVAHYERVGDGVARVARAAGRRNRVSRVLAYTSPARGHLLPFVPILDELRTRGDDVAVRTLSSQVGPMRERGFRAAAIAPAVEAIEPGAASSGGTPRWTPNVKS